MGTGSEKLTYKADGKAYSGIQGQTGAVYSFNLNETDKTLDFFFVDTHPTFMIVNPCNTANGGCLRRANVQFISGNLLVIGNSFSGTQNGATYNVTIVDSLKR